MKTDPLRRIASRLGKRGGKKTLEKYGNDYFKEISKKGVEARRKKRQLKETIKSSNPKTLEMIELYKSGKSYQDIGRLYGMSRQRVHQLITGYRSFATAGLSMKNYLGLGIGFCRSCEGKAEHVHHVDGNSRNNKQENLMPLCRKCHVLIHKKQS